MKTNLKRFWTSYWWVLFVLVLHAGAFSACTSALGRHLRTYAKARGDHRDLSTERPSDHGLYRVSFEPQVEAIPLSRLHTWKIRVHTADSVAVDEAAILVDGGMPEHGHGLPTRPGVTQALGGGAYLVEGMKFHMPGWWVVRFDVTAAGGADTVTFNLIL